MTSKLAVFNDLKPSMSKAYLMQVRSHIQLSSDIDALMDYLRPILGAYNIKPCDSFFIAHDLMELKGIDNHEQAKALIKTMCKVALVDKSIALQMRRYMRSKYDRFNSKQNNTFKPVGKHALRADSAPRTFVLPEFDQDERVEYVSSASCKTLRP